jgi:hypothetical protein
MISNVYKIHFNTHIVSVSVTEDGVYHMFKYNDIRCEMETFTCRSEAEEYVLIPFPNIEFLVTVNDDDEEDDTEF